MKLASIYDRQRKKYITEKAYKEDTLKLLYNTVIGRFLLKIVVAQPWFSNLLGKYKDSTLSKKDILPFIEKYKVDTKDYDLSTMKSFNDFFTRKKKIKIQNKDEKALLAVADAKLSAYKVTNNLKLNIKNSSYTVGEILNNEELAKQYRNGICLVYRLTMDDYHRYHFLDRGFIKKHYKIKGELHTVRPLSSKYNVFSRNTREVTVMNTDNFGEVIQVEVGAMLVGKIKNHNNGIMFSRLEEKGYFEYGGSTVIVLLKDGVVELDKDIQICSKRNLEVKVRIGEKIGQKV